MITPDIITTLIQSGRAFEVTPDGGLIVEAVAEPDTRSRKARNQAAYRARNASQSTTERSYPPSRVWLDLRAKVFARDGNRCTYCGSDGGGAALHCDHILAVSRGGTHTLDNLTTSCRSCNTSKNDMPVEEWTERRGIK